MILDSNTRSGRTQGWMELKIISIYMKFYDDMRQEGLHEGITSNFFGNNI